ncbi:MAG: tRNA (guanine(10)-N(2))-dimethyltransferase [Candidatus Bathyarchaeia archaeon]
MSFPAEFVVEGKVKVLVPKLGAFVKAPSEYAPSKAPVFYNPAMELNRDIAVLALQAYQKIVNREVGVCEPLSGCGVRGIRFAVEVEGVRNVLINDINNEAFRLAKQNVQLNGLEKRVKVRNEDANLLLSHYAAPRKRFDVIDLDPFGSPVPYLDSTLRALRDGGLLALTATDMAPLCGVHPKACIRKYGGNPLRTEYCHELAVRLLLGCVATTAAKHDIGISVVFSHSTDHYIRAYAIIKHAAKAADQSLKNMGYILHCFKCFHRETVNPSEFFGHSRKCCECGSKLYFAGPLWLGKLADKGFCERMLGQSAERKFRHEKRIMKILSLVKCEVDAPATYFVVDKFCDVLGLPVPPIKRVLEALKERGYQTFLTHFDPKGVKSNVSAMEFKNILFSLKEGARDRVQRLL